MKTNPLKEVILNILGEEYIEDVYVFETDRVTDITIKLKMEGYTICQKARQKLLDILKVAVPLVAIKFHYKDKFLYMYVNNTKEEKEVFNLPEKL
jgi:hypothetical protein